MRITELIAHHVRIPLRKRIQHASHSRTSTDSIVVCCRLENGATGWGEGLPREYVTGETIESAWNLLKSTDFKGQLGGAIDGLPEAIQLCSGLALSGQPPNSRECFGNSVRCAVELAILDAVCRSEQLPLSTVTSLVPETIAIRQSAEKVQYSAAITAASPIKELNWAWLYRLLGFRHCKVKVGVAGRDDVATLRRIRMGLGKRVDIRIDANESWTCENIEEKVAPLKRFNISAIEQPVPHADVDGLSDVRRRLGIPIVHDESLCSSEDAHRAIERGTCDLFNLRLSKCGGLISTLRLAALAHQAGLGYQLGCQVGETGILSAAGRHFAVSIAGIRYCEGSYDRFLVKERLTQEDLTFGFRGMAPALTGPGLGVTIDEKGLTRVTVATDRWSIA